MQLDRRFNILIAEAARNEFTRRSMGLTNCQEASIERHHAADGLAALQRRKAVVDLIQRNPA
jgi:hypothetical protein